MFYGGELVYVILAPLAIVGVIVLAIVALAGRSDADSRGERAYVLYLSLVSFIALFTVLFALTDLASTATEALVDGPEECVEPFDPACLESGSFQTEVGGELRTRSIVNTAGVALAAGAVLLFHRRRSQALASDPGFPGSAGARTFTAYLYAVCFVAMATVLVAAAITLPALVRVVAPGLTALGSSGAERDSALTDLVPALVAGGGAVVIYLFHWREAEGLRRGDAG